jgi:group I intron endonuclease
MIHSVYKTINLINQKYYIGKHSSEEPNDAYLGSGKALKNAIKKYGIEHFRKEILYIFNNELDAYNKEKNILEEIGGVNDPLCYNLCYGGIGFWEGSSHSEESRLKISERNRGKKRSVEAKARYSAAKAGTKLSEDTKKKISEFNLGKKLSDDTKKKISESNMGRIVTGDTKDKISKANTGKPSKRKGVRCSEETKQKMSKSQKGRIVTEDMKNKLKKYTQEKNSQFGTMWVTDGNTNMKINKNSIIPPGWSKGRTFKEGYKNVRN